MRCRAVVARRVLFCRIVWADNIGGWGFHDCFRLSLDHVSARFSRRRVSAVGDDRPLMQIGQGGATRGIRIQDPGKGCDQVGASGAGDPRYQRMAAGTHIKVSPASEAVNQHPCYTHTSIFNTACTFSLPITRNHPVTNVLPWHETRLSRAAARHPVAQARAVVSGGCQDLPLWVNDEVLPRWLQFGLG